MQGSVDVSSNDLSNGGVYCVCKKDIPGRMIACDNTACYIEWFHYSCVGITRAPKGKWYCPNCMKM